MRCPSCQQENPPNAKFCVECATPMPLACAQCGTQIPRTAKFCPECAHPTALAKAAPPSQPRAAQPVAPAALLGGPSVAVAPAAQAVQPLGAAASVPAGYPFRAVSAVPAPQNVAVGEPATSRQNTLADADASAVMQRLAQVPAPLATPRPAMPGSEAERRQLTVMFCDLVGSTQLSSSLDPEELREVVRSYQHTAAEVIARYEGYIAQYLGDGLLVYFGFPNAHEDDAQRAARAGLGIIAAIEQLNARLQSGPGVRLRVRIGVHTGLVVVGEMGGGGRTEQLALGDTPNIAARLEGLAEPGSVVISAATHRLIQNVFSCQDLGPRPLKGLPAPMQVYRLAGEHGARPAGGVDDDGPLVGRQQEVGLLRDRWDLALEGMGQVVLISGEAGIGKSRLLQLVRQNAAAVPHSVLLGRCSPYHQSSPLYAVIDALQSAFQLTPEDPPEAQQRKLLEGLGRFGVPPVEAAPLLAALLGLPPLPEYPMPPLPPQRLRQLTHEVVIGLLLAKASRGPVLLIVEDLHWMDPSSQELLSQLIHQVPTARILLVLTARPEFRPPWGSPTHLAQVTLSRLSARQVEELVSKRTGGKPLPPEVLQQVAAKTDGVPLFVEELTKMILESGLLTERGGRYELTGPLPQLAIPSTLQGSLMARLDRLATVKAMAQLGATLGREFGYALLKAVCSMDDLLLQQEVRRLVEAELLYQRGVPPMATYTFKHALIQQAAYQSLLKSKRQEYHQRIARALEEGFPGTRDAQPELLAHHYTEAGMREQAVGYWLKAGQRAIEQSANQEAAQYLRTGLEVLAVVPESPERAQRELELLLALGVPLIATKGYGSQEVERVYARARELCQRIGDTSRLPTLLWGLWVFYLVGGRLKAALEVAEQYRALASHHPQDTFLQVETCQLMGVTLFHLGELGTASRYLEQGRAIYEPDKHHALIFQHGGADTGESCQVHAALGLWMRGQAETARERLADAGRLARELAHPFTSTFSDFFAAWIHHLCGDDRAVQQAAAASIEVSNRHGFPFWGSLSAVLKGWSLVSAGSVEQGVEEMEQAHAAFSATGAECYQLYFLGLLAQAYGKAGKWARALETVDLALTTLVRNDDRLWEAELYRVKAELLLGQAPAGARSPEAEALLGQALAAARRREQQALVLRTSVSLARLRQRQGEAGAARQVLAEALGGLPAGSDSRDVREAQALLATFD